MLFNSAYGPFMMRMLSWTLKKRSMTSFLANSGLIRCLVPHRRAS